MTKVRQTAQISARVRYSNDSDTTRVNNITAEAQVRDGNVENIENGNVFNSGAQIASFNCWGENLSVNFQNVTAAEQTALLAEIQTFISDVKEDAQTAAGAEEGAAV